DRGRREGGPVPVRIVPELVGAVDLHAGRHQVNPLGVHRAEGGRLRASFLVRADGDDLRQRGRPHLLGRRPVGSSSPVEVSMTWVVAVRMVPAPSLAPVRTLAPFPAAATTVTALPRSASTALVRTRGGSSSLVIAPKEMLSTASPASANSAILTATSH